MRDHTKLRSFQLADELVLQIYRTTRRFPKEELFGLTSQMRRASVSIATNIVEGCGRRSEADYLHFLDMAYSSAREVEYQASLASRLGYIDSSEYEELREMCDHASRSLNALVQALRQNRRTAASANVSG